MLLPAGSEVAIVEPEHLRSEPGGNMNAVRDMADGNGVFRFARIQAGPHTARYFAVQGGDGVRAARHFQTEYSHAEVFVIVAGIFAPELHQTRMREAELLAQRAEMFF